MHKCLIQQKYVNEQNFAEEDGNPWSANRNKQ